MNGWIKYNRMLLDSVTFKRGAEYIALFTYLLLNAQYKDGYRSDLKAGQLFVTVSRLSEETGLSDHPLRRMLRNMQTDGVISVANSRFRRTLITVNDWRVYGEADAGWVRLHRELPDGLRWKDGIRQIGVWLWLLLNAEREGGYVRRPQSEISAALKVELNELRALLRALKQKNVIKTSDGKIAVTVDDKAFAETKERVTVEPRSSHGQAEVEPRSSRSQALYMDKEVRIKKEEGRGEGSASFLAEKLSAVFAAKGISRRDEVSSLAKRTERIIKGGAPPERIADCISWYAGNYFDQVYDGYTFQRYFDVLLEKADGQKREAEERAELRAAVQYTRREEEIKYKEDRRRVEEALRVDKFYLVRKFAKTPQLAISVIDKMVERGQATKEEAEQIKRELKAVDKFTPSSEQSS